MDGVWYGLIKGYADEVYGRFESAINEAIERETNMSTQTQNNTKEFKVGDRVQLETGWSTHKGVVQEAGLLKIKWDDGDVTYEKPSDMEYAKLSEEDAWIEVALMIGKEAEGGWYSDIELRQRAYQILGGNGVKVGRQGTPEHEEIKARLNALIERAKRV